MSFGHGPWLPAYHYQDGRYFSVSFKRHRTRVETWVGRPSPIRTQSTVWQAGLENYFQY